MNDRAAELKTLLARIRAEEAALRAFTVIAADPAKPVYGPSPARPLGGLAVAIKDIIDTADMPTGYGSLIYDGNQPRVDGAIVTALKQAGAFIVGKTTTTEFATSPPTETRNPHSPLHTPGGSSAGSAAAVAGGLVPLALGTQTLGSVLRPASYCGVVGFKPSYGWFPTAGMKQLAASLDTIGWLAKNVVECEGVHRALMPADAEARPHTLRLAFSRQPNWHLATPDAQEAIEACIGRLRGGGLDNQEVQMPPGFGAMDGAANVIHDFEMYRSLKPELLVARDKIHPTLVARIERAASRSLADYRYAFAVAAAQRAAFSTFMQDYDGVLCLAATGEAPLLERATTGDPFMNSAWTALYVPCISLPAMTGATGLPIGLQIVADRYQDMKLLRLAAAIEAELAG